MYHHVFCSANDVLVKKTSLFSNPRYWIFVMNHAKAAGDFMRITGLRGGEAFQDAPGSFIINMHVERAPARPPFLGEKMASMWTSQDLKWYLEIEPWNNFLP